MEKTQIQEKKKAWLRRYRKNIEMLSRLQEKHDLLDHRLTAIKSPSPTGMPRGGTPVTVADLVSEKLELEERIARSQEKCKTIRREILAVIDDLDDIRYCEILEEYFIKQKSFAEISNEMSYSEKSVIRLYSQAIDLLCIPGLSEDGDE